MKPRERGLRWRAKVLGLSLVWFVQHVSISRACGSSLVMIAWACVSKSGTKVQVPVQIQAQAQGDIVRSINLWLDSYKYFDLFSSVGA